ncbi:MAG: hypothetical protein U5J83_05625, partial [Bryobacterales bacterium]|nr:hypothetical protein [Bryobacterales bacterium]
MAFRIRSIESFVASAFPKAFCLLPLRVLHAILSVALALFVASALPAQPSGGMKEIYLQPSHMAIGTVTVNGVTYRFFGELFETLRITIDPSKPLLVQAEMVARPSPGLEYRLVSIVIRFGTGEAEAYEGIGTATVQDPSQVDGISIGWTRYIRVTGVAEGPGRVIETSPFPPDSEGFRRSPAFVSFEAIPDPGKVFQGWYSDRVGYGFNPLPDRFSEPETLVARFATPTLEPPILRIEGSIPTFRYRSDQDVLEATIRVTAERNVTPSQRFLDCEDSRANFIRAEFSNDTTPFDIRFTVSTALVDYNHVPNGEYSCRFIIGRRDGGPTLTIPIKTILGPSTAEPETSGPSAEATVDGASFRPLPLAAASIFSIFGKRLSASTTSATTLPLPNRLGTTEVLLTVGGQSWKAPLFYVSETQVNFLVPAEVPSGGGTLEVIRDDAASPVRPITVEAVAPALFTANSDGKGAPAGYAIRVLGEHQERDELSTCATLPCTPRPLTSTDPNEEIFLILFGTGFRNDRRAIPESNTNLNQVHPK